MEVWLRMPYEVRYANRIDLESWLIGRLLLASVDRGEHWLGIELRNLRRWGVDDLPLYGRQHLQKRKWEVAVRPHGVRDPVYVSVYFMHGTWEIPFVAGGIVDQQVGKRR